MIYNTDLCVAIKGEDGKYNVNDTSIFNLCNINKISTNLKITYNSDGMYSILVKCPVCGKIHIYKHTKKELLGGNVIFIGCKNYNTGIVIIGDKRYILNHIYNYDYINNSLYALL